MTDIINIIEDGGDIKLANGWEYERLEQYPGAEPGLILGVYRASYDGGWWLIAHDSRGRVVHANGKTPDAMLGASGLELVPTKREFKVKIKRVVTEYAWVKVEATDAEVAESEATTYAEDNCRDIDWDDSSEEPEYEALDVRVL